jgi:ubiquinone/menaquinone biosynthesis C-methylase UbiE
MKPPPEVTAYYERFAEEARLESGEGQLELERTKEILGRILPKPPAHVVDVGGAAGVYSIWLAAQGYEVHLVDASVRLVEEARRRSATVGSPLASLSVGDARRLDLPDRLASVVLIMGPLYHLIEAADRAAALAEARRVLMPGGRVAVAAISRFASALDGLRRARALDPAFVRLRDRDLRDGVHINETNHPEYFTSAYFHRPDELRSELEAAGFAEVQVLGVEGPGWMVADFDARWNDPVLRKDLLDVARALEAEPTIIGASPHLLGLARRG